VIMGAGRPVEQTLGHLEGDVQIGRWANIVDPDSQPRPFRRRP
jgi:hypothetical protein